VYESEREREGEQMYGVVGKEETASILYGKCLRD